MEIPADVRLLLIRRCRSRRTRTAVFTRCAPCDWRPFQLRDPRCYCDLYFTEESAWEYIADALEANCEVEKIMLVKPAGKFGYVLLLPSMSAAPIYVKLQLGSETVIGRSFHESYRVGEAYAK